MQKTFTIYPIDEEPVDDYDNIQGDYIDQFYLPFGRECVDFIDETLRAENKVHIDVAITNEKGTYAYSKIFTPTEIDYFGDDGDGFDDILWNLRTLGTLIISVNICLGEVVLAN
jgi:hypothetical protein